MRNSEKVEEILSEAPKLPEGHYYKLTYRTLSFYDYTLEIRHGYWKFFYEIVSSNGFSVLPNYPLEQAILDSAYKAYELMEFLSERRDKKDDAKKLIGF